MSHTRRTVLVALLAGAIIGCSDDDGPGQFRYPLKVGATWNYTRTWYTGPDMDSLGLALLEPVRVSIGAKENLPTVGESFRMDVAHPDDPGVTGAVYYQNTDAGLWQVAYCPAGGVVTPKHGLGTEVAEIMRQLDLASPLICKGPPTIDSEPDKSLPYPLRIGQQWHFRSVEEIPMSIDKRITGWNEVEVPAGKFNAYRVEWIYSSGVNASIVDDIASVGLVRRQATIRFQINDPVNPGQYLENISYDVLELDSLRLR